MIPSYMKLLYHLAMFVMALMAGVLLMINYWLFWPVRTLVINNYTEDAPIQLKDNVLQPGEILEYTLDYCKYYDGEPTVFRRMIDGQVITIQDAKGNLPMGCRKAQVRNVVVPPTVNPGMYYLDVIVEYQVNPLRKIRTHYRTDYFSVVPRDEGDPYREKLPDQPIKVIE